MICSVFVYGTLQSTGCRATAWPHAPRRIVAARARGQLFDLGPYPALRPGDHWIGGERWELSPESMEATLQVLDAIEGYDRSAHDLYHRQVITCWDEDETQYSAYTYFYAQPLEILGAVRVPPDASGVCRWDPRFEPGDELL